MHSDKVHKRVAKIHKESIDQGFLSILGVRFLTLLYWAIDIEKDSVLLVEEIKGEVVGFVSASLDMKAVLKRMLHRPFAVFFAVLPSILRFERLFKIFEVLKYTSSSFSDNELPQAELLSIAVTPSFRGKKVADSLYGKLIIHFKNNNINSFTIVVGSTLKNALSFYERMGAQPNGMVEVHAGHSSILYVQKII